MLKNTNNYSYAVAGNGIYIIFGLKSEWEGFVQTYGEISFRGQRRGRESPPDLFILYQ